MLAALLEGLLEDGALTSTFPPTCAGAHCTSNSAGGDREQRHIEQLGQGPKDGQSCPHSCTGSVRVRALLDVAAHSTTERTAHLLPGPSPAC